MFAKLLHETLHTEMELHRDYCRRLGIPRGELEHTPAAPVTHAYTRHLLEVAWSGSIAEIIAAVLPCQLGYAEIATTLVWEQPNWQSSPYAEWIRTYASAEFIESAERLRDLLDTMTSQWPEALRKPLEENFLTSSRYEYLFWEMAWNQAGWPV
jgi:thiaminase/transcriptional activator TenA